MSADSAVVAHYRAFIEEFGAHDSKLRRYPGSPRLLERLRRPSDRVSCYELEPTPFSQLTSAPFDGAIERVHGDGLAALRARCAEPTSGGLVGLIDPPWNVKADWRTIPGAVIDCLKATPTAVIAVWYPIKSYTRVNQMIRTIREAGLPYLVGDLITTPLELQRNRLNGSGIIVINPPSDLAPTLAAAAAVIGAACASHHGFFELRLTASALAAEAAPAALTAGEHRANGENAIA
jgi:23S rRNA (adenine2030-N6)-methyltransferase